MKDINPVTTKESRNSRVERSKTAPKPRKGKGKRKTKSHGKGFRKKKNDEDMSREWHGVGFAYKAEFEKTRMFFKQLGSRRMEIQFNAQGGPIKFHRSLLPWLFGKTK